MRVKKSINTNKLYYCFFAILALTGICIYMYIARGQFVYAGDRALYMDDMAEHKIMTNPDTSIWDKITDKTSNKVRYITNIAMIIFWKIVGTNYDRVDTVLLCANFMLMLIVWGALYFIARTDKGDDKIKRIVLATGGTIAVVSSRFAYYSFEESFGIMEDMGMALAIVLVVLLVLDDFKFTKKYWLAHIVWICDIYVHERYMVLGVVLLVYSVLAAIYNKEKIISPKPIMRVSLIVIFLIMTWGYRILLFGNRAVDGTGGTSISDTFKISTLREMLIKELLYLVGINPRNDGYLNGIEPTDVGLGIYILTALVWLFACLIIFLYAKSIRDNKRDWCKLAIFFVTIVCLVLASSVTIRVEMRWIYASFAVEIMAMVYMLSCVLKNSGEEKKMLCTLVALASVLLVVVVENFYSNHWDAIYNWGVRQERSALSDELDKYSQIDNLYIITGVSLWEDEIHELARIEGLELNNLIQLEDIKSIDCIGENDVVLLKDDVENDYYDLTEAYHTFKYREGYYGDGWCEPYTNLGVYSSDNGSLYLKFYIPDSEIIGEGNTITIMINGEVKGTLEVARASYPEIEVDGLLRGENNVELIADFCTIENSGRSEDGRLSYGLAELSVNN